jgi:hypothetical protein
MWLLAPHLGANTYERRFVLAFQLVPKVGSRLHVSGILGFGKRTLATILTGQ